MYHFDKYLGAVYPYSIDDMEACIVELDNGNDPITDKWEDGLGNCCTLDGWAQ